MGAKMGRQISMDVRDELLEVLGKRYRKSTPEEKGQILNEFVEVSGYHRKHAIRLLSSEKKAEVLLVKSRRIYDEAVKEVLIFLWETSDRICSKRLKPAIPALIEALEQHGHLVLDKPLKAQVLAVSPATIDRILSPVRKAAGVQRKRRRLTRLKKKIPIKTSSDWSDSQSGYFEADFVVHSGGSMSGHPIYTLVVTDVASGWTDFIPLLAREQNLITEALDVFQEQLPIPILGLNTDNDSAFINDTLVEYCEANGIEFSRARPGRKNDQAWIEQKNGAIIRKVAGYDRYEGIEAGKILCKLFNATRLLTNFFQPSFKLKEKIREGAKVKKTYYPPMTPCDRLLADPIVSSEVKRNLRLGRRSLDPVLLLQNMREAQTRLVELSDSQSENTFHSRQSLDEFVKQLPAMWELGEVRPTDRKKHCVPHTWRTRKDPFVVVFPQVLNWLAAQPDRTAKELFIRLQDKYPGEFKDGQLRTLQRRVKDWRKQMARNLLTIYSYEEMNRDEVTTTIAR